MFSEKIQEYERLSGVNTQEVVENNFLDDETLIHVVPNSSKSRWNHVEDLDNFFARVYNYHRRHGFICILVQEILDLVQFVFVMFFSTYLLRCVDYPVLFRDKDVNPGSTKVRIGDALIPVSMCMAGVPPVLTVCIIVSTLFWTFRVARFVYHIINYWEIRSFYQLVLNIHESELENFTWNEVQSRLRQAQRDHLMCIHKVDLTDLDIHHRILRFTNYFVAMLNKNVLPVKYKVPAFGEVVFLTKGLKYNLELVLFWGVGAPFDSSWHLREEFKRPSKRQELADKLTKRMRTVGFLNLVMSPLIVIWQLLHSVFRYAEELKRNPSLLGVRKWSLYGRYYLRHFNELDHDVDARLSRAYSTGSRYMSSFSSPIMAILARHIQFICGSVLFVLVCLTVWDEDVITVEHLITLISALGAGIAVCSSFIPDENVVFFHDDLLSAVLAHVHYLPVAWIHEAHMSKVRAGFSQLFQLKLVFLVEELLSPIITPLVLLCHLPKFSLKIVDFLRNHTVDVIGVGDVCSFAQLDVARHGDPKCRSFEGEKGEDLFAEKPKNAHVPAEGGKTELSLVHFALTNPEWKPPNASQEFLENLNRQIQANDPVLMAQSEEFLRSVIGGTRNIMPWVKPTNHVREIRGYTLTTLPSVQPTWGRSFLTSELHSMSPASGYQSFMQPPGFNMGRVTYRPGFVETSDHLSQLDSSRIDVDPSSIHRNSAQSRSSASSEDGMTRQLATAREMARSALYIHSNRRRQSEAERLPNIVETDDYDRSPMEQEMSPLLRLARST